MNNLFNLINTLRSWAASSLIQTGYAIAPENFIENMIAQAMKCEDES